MLRGRYGWLSQRNQFILPSPPSRHHPSSALLQSLPPRQGGRREKEGVYRITHTRARTPARAYIGTRRNTIVKEPSPSPETHGHLWKRGTGLKRDRAERLIWFNGEFIWVDSPPFNQQDCFRPPTDTATDRLPCRPTFSLPSPRKIIPVKPPLYHHGVLTAVSVPREVPLFRAPGTPEERRRACGCWSASFRNRGDGYYHRLIPSSFPSSILSPLLDRALLNPADPSARDAAPCRINP